MERNPVIYSSTSHFGYYSSPSQFASPNSCHLSSQSLKDKR
jgi:hypothetical protein